jgi:hypothetical protein
MLGQISGASAKRRSASPPSQLLLPSEEFLFDTLAFHTTLHSRNNSGYITVRRWRKPFKAYQVGALRIAKKAPSVQFVERVTDEILKALERFLAVPAFANVVPVPPGSSRMADSLSVLLARRLAVELGAESHNCLLAPSTPQGRSHPKKSAQLGPYRIKEKIEGWTLLVDDVASSGRHMELAHKALKASGVPVVGLAWIGQ